MIGTYGIFVASKSLITCGVSHINYMPSNRLWMMKPSSQEKNLLGLGMRLSCIKSYALGGMPSQLLSLQSTCLYNHGNNCCVDLQFGMATLSEIVVEVMAS